MEGRSSSRGMIQSSLFCRAPQWKVYRRRQAELIRRGVSREMAQRTAWSVKGPWALSQAPGVRIALPNAYFDRLGLLRLANHQRIQP